MRYLCGCFLVLAFGCTTGLQKSYVVADEENHSVLSPAIEKWLAKEPGNVIKPGPDADDAKHAYEIKLRSWKFRIDEAKRLIAEQEAND